MKEEETGKGPLPIARFVEKGILDPGEELTGARGDKELVALVTEDNQLQIISPYLSTETHTTASSAYQEVFNGGNGLDFWRNSQGKSLKDLWNTSVGPRYDIPNEITNRAASASIHIAVAAIDSTNEALGNLLAELTKIKQNLLSINE